MYLTRCWFIFFLTLISCTGWSQTNYLALDKPGKTKRLRFYVGDEIGIKLKGENRLYKDIITAIGDSSIEMMDTHIPIKDIRMIRIPPKGGLLKSAKFILPRAGILYVLAATLNPVITAGGDITISNSDLLVGGAFVGSALVLRLLERRNFHINKYRRVRILETVY